MKREGQESGARSHRSFIPSFHFPFWAIASRTVFFFFFFFFFTHLALLRLVRRVHHHSCCCCCCRCCCCSCCRGGGIQKWHAQQGTSQHEAPPFCCGRSSSDTLLMRSTGSCARSACFRWHGFDLLCASPPLSASPTPGEIVIVRLFNVCLLPFHSCAFV